jgi:hypothetical protein
MTEDTKVYNIAFNSFQGTGADTRSLTYNFDWNILEQGEYELTWTMATSQYTFATPAVYSPLYVQVDFGQQLYPLNSNTKVIGFCNTPNMSNGIQTYYYASNIMNPTIHLNHRPNNNIFTIQLLQNTQANGLTPFYINNAAIGSYIIFFHFKLIKKH